ncbi:MAG TPA: FAD-dependent oxidoreductase [Candidatus Paceibacterota bacterium]
MIGTSLIYDTIIAGSGAAGLSAAIYAGRYLMKTLVVRGNFGGETATAGQIWNYPGAPGADGYDLMKSFEKQAKDSGAEIINGKVTGAKNNSGCFDVEVGPKTYHAKTLIFAQGAERRHLGLAREEELTAKGVHYCVTCDGPLYTGKTVAMVGGGDASVKGILDLAKYVDKLYFIVRADKLTRPEPVNLEELDKLGDKVITLYSTEVKELVGEGKLEKVILSREFDGSRELVIDGLFVEIGAKPDVFVPTSLGVALDKIGYINVDNLMQTNVPGVYAAGDTVNHFGPFKQTITAAALGAVAATSAYNYYKKHGNLCQTHWKVTSQ